MNTQDVAKNLKQAEIDKNVNSISILSENYDKDLLHVNTNVSDGITTNNQGNFQSVIAPPRLNKQNIDTSFFQQSIMHSGIHMSSLLPSEIMKR